MTTPAPDPFTWRDGPILKLDDDKWQALRKRLEALGDSHAYVTRQIALVLCAHIVDEAYGSRSHGAVNDPAARDYVVAESITTLLEHFGPSR